MNYLRVIILLFLTLTVSFSNDDYKHHIHTVIIPKDWKPYYFIKEDGKPSGFAVELFEEIAKEADIQFQYKIVDSWKELWPYFESGEAHVVPDLGISDIRKDFSVFSIPTNTFEIDLFKRYNSNHINSIDDLDGKKVAVVYRNIGQQVMENYPNIQKVVFDNHFNAIRALLSGSVDAFVYPKPLMHQILIDLNIHDKITYFDKPLLEIKRAIGISLKHKALLEPINNALEKFMKTAKYNELYQKYFGKKKLIELTYSEILFLIFLITSVVSGIIFVLFYISKKKRWLMTQDDLSKQLKIKTKELQHSKDDLKKFFDINPNILFITDGLQLKIANQSFLNFVQFDTAEHFKEKHECICDFFVKKEGYIPKFMEDGTLWIDYIYARPDEIHKALIIKNLKEYVFDISVVRIKSDNTYLVLFHDMSILEDITVALHRSNEDLQQFAYIASHDLQEPLRMVSSYLQLIERRYKDKLDDEGVEFIGFAVDGAKRMQSLINGLLQFSRVQTKGEEFVRVDMNTVLEETKQNLSLLITDKKVILNIDSNLPFIRADKRQMIQLFQNIIGNAIKYCEKIPQIDITFTQTEDEVVFIVQDNGIGIDKEYYDRIFLIFQRLHGKESQYEGTGIGLAVCKRIMQRHGGDIEVDSVVGEGSRFILKFNKKGLENG